MSARSQAAIAIVPAFLAAALVAGCGNGANTTTAQKSTTAPKSTPVATTPAVRVIRKAIEVDANGAVGGVQQIDARSGDRIVIVVRSSGYSGEVHLHGFDIKREVAPGRPATFVIGAAQTSDARGQGSFEMELEGIAVQIAKLLISP